MEPPLHEQPAHDIARLVRDRRVSATEVAEHFLARIERFDPGVRAYLHVDADGARRTAARLDERIGRGEPAGSLAGVPVALKDNLCTRGSPTTCGSRILETFEPPYDATAVQRLRDADAVPVGKTNLDEFAMGSSCENSAFFPTRNPHAPDRVPGGSSGGSAAAVAAGLCAVALGSDTGGSIRQPAALCGVVGLKPTYGRVSRYGLVAFASSLDQIGPLARDVRDAATVLSVVGGADPRDKTTVSDPLPDLERDLESGAEGLRLGIPQEYFPDSLAAEVRAPVEAAVERLRDAGASVRDVSLPHTAYVIATYYVVANCEASSNLARYDGVRFGSRAAGPSSDPTDMMVRSRTEGFGPEVKRRILLGTFALSTGYADRYYKKALEVRARIREDFRRAFAEVDLLVAPTSPFPAFRLGEKTADPLDMYLCDVLTAGANLAGVPAVSLPCGRTASGLPVGLQLVGPAFSEATLLRAARAIERSSGTPAPPALAWAEREPAP